MDMTLSKRGDYVMRAAISLARAYEEGSYHKIREVVAETEVPQTFASQILADLVRAGLATSRAGREGGYRLSRDPSEVSVLEVIEASEGPLQAERCALGDGPCRWDAVCPLHETWSAATVALRELLSATTLAEVAARDVAIEEGAYAVPLDAHRSHPLALPLTDLVHVERGASEVRRGLVRVARALPTLVDAAVEEPLRGRAQGAAGGRGKRRRSRAIEASLVPVSPSATAEAAVDRYLLAWRIGGPEGGHRLEADLSVVAIDPERSEVRLEGTWHRQPDSVPALAGPELEQSVRRSVRVFLRGMAGALEGSSAAQPDGKPRTMAFR